MFYNQKTNFLTIFAFCIAILKQNWRHATVTTVILAKTSPWMSFLKSNKKQHRHSGHFVKSYWLVGKNLLWPTNRSPLAQFFDEGGTIGLAFPFFWGPFKYEFLASICADVSDAEFENSVNWKYANTDLLNWTVDKYFLFPCAMTLLQF